jgi:hypothetical protein
MNVCTGTLVPAKTGVPPMISGETVTTRLTMTEWYSTQTSDGKPALAALPAVANVQRDADDDPAEVAGHALERGAEGLGHWLAWFHGPSGYTGNENTEASSAVLVARWLEKAKGQSVWTDWPWI